MAKQAKGIDEELRDAIRASRRSRYAIAKDAGISSEQVYRFMARTHDLRMATAAKIARVLGLGLVKSRGAQVR